MGGTRVTSATRGLLLDIGGVVLAGGPALANRWAAGEPALAAVGALGGPEDDLWQRMLGSQVSERSYWETRAREFGAALGLEWTTRDLMNVLYARPEAEWLNGVVVDLMREVKAARLPLAALTNDLRDFHGQEWVDRQEWVRLFDTIVDASVTGILKPAPDAFAAGAAALGLPPGDVVYLDDMPWNVEGALAAGLDAHRVRHEDPGEAVAWARARLGLTP
ncbi:MAG: HAD-IA family hydrolase [Kineosporiaceae bacterium]